MTYIEPSDAVRSQPYIIEWEDETGFGMRIDDDSSPWIVYTPSQPSGYWTEDEHVTVIRKWMLSDLAEQDGDQATGDVSNPRRGEAFVVKVNDCDDDRDLPGRVVVAVYSSPGSSEDWKVFSEAHPHGWWIPGRYLTVLRRATDGGTGISSGEGTELLGGLIARPVSGDLLHHLVGKTGAVELKVATFTDENARDVVRELEAMVNILNEVTGSLRDALTGVGA